jgi:uncharacterized protein (TIGR03083 family)
MTSVRPPEPAFGARVDVRALFERDRADLDRLLGELSPGDWERTTAAAPWTVRDVVAHLLGDDVARLSRTRDGFTGLAPEQGEGLPGFLHRINDEWVRAAARMSPLVLRDLLAASTPAVLALWRDADLDALGEPVSWTSPEPAPVWLDCARDFTEYWVHQQQIRLATDRPADPEPETVHAVLDIFLRAVPLALARAGGDTVSVVVPGTAGGTWSWVQSGAGWLPADPRPRATAVVSVDAETLWQVAVRMIEPTEARARARLDGDRALGGAVLELVSIIR